MARRHLLQESCQGRMMKHNSERRLPILDPGKECLIGNMKFPEDTRIEIDKEIDPPAVIVLVEGPCLSLELWLIQQFVSAKYMTKPHEYLEMGPRSFKELRDSQNWEASPVAGAWKYFFSSWRNSESYWSYAMPRKQNPRVILMGLIGV
ncbi:hypothetical protein VNO77_42373 [Canavalia gladiata]|uniref:Uncharacterized protein n=1 Tax=Canavalia gladiata TaxID=3824 RepID=A0AAN9PSS4_CANGL